jgi:hypothetical protein
MRVLRLSMWAAPDQPPITTVMRDSDLRMSVEETIEELFAEPPEAPAIERPIDNPVFGGVFFVYEVFDMQNDEIMQATAEATRRMERRALTEQNMAVLYFYNTQALRPVQENGHLINPKPAPLNVTDIEMALKQVAKHPNYQHQRVVTTSHDGVVVEMQNGDIKKMPLRRR